MLHARTTTASRRLAVQIAIQLPERVDEARQVLDLTREMLDKFMIEPGPRSLEQYVESRPAAPRTVFGAKAILLSIATLAASVPLALLLSRAPEVFPGWAFIFGVAAVAVLFGTRCALILGAMSAVIHNLVIVQPWMSFSVPTWGELANLAGYVVIAVGVPWLMRHHNRIRERMLSRPAEAPTPAALMEMVRNAV